MNVALNHDQLSTLDAAAKASAQSLATSSASAAAATAANATTASSAGTAGSALTSLSGKFDDFLKLFTAQLKNQDPSSPMDTNQFTTELVQFSSVEQQVQTNTNLTQLLQLTQDSELGQSTSLIGKQVNISGNSVPLQSSRATINFTTAAAEPIAVSITNAAGQDVKDVDLAAAAGANSWTWDGTSNSGRQLPDGPYNVAVKTADATGAVTDVAFTATGTPTSVQRGGKGLTVSFGPTTLDFGSVQSLAQ